MYKNIYNRIKNTKLVEAQKKKQFGQQNQRIDKNGQRKKNIEIKRRNKMT